MKTNTSMLKIAKGLGSVGLLFTVSKMDGAEAIKTEMTTQADATLEAEIASMANSVQQALSGEGSEALSESELKGMIESHMQQQVAEMNEEKAVSNNFLNEFLHNSNTLTNLSS